MKAIGVDVKPLERSLPADFYRIICSENETQKIADLPVKARNPALCAMDTQESGSSRHRGRICTAPYEDDLLQQFQWQGAACAACRSIGREFERMVVVQRISSRWFPVGDCPARRPYHDPAFACCYSSARLRYTSSGMMYTLRRGLKKWRDQSLETPLYLFSPSHSGPTVTLCSILSNKYRTRRV